MGFAVVDLFAGAGGLGEGFARAGFDNVLSCEAEVTFTETLKLRHFVRNISQENFHTDYYRFLAGEIEQDVLYARHPEAASKATASSFNYTLGTETKNKTFHERLRQQIGEQEFGLLGGPPCQAYSLAGRSRRLGLQGTKREQNKRVTEFYKDEKHLLYLNYLETVAFHMPAFFLMENVKGLLSAKKADDAERGSVFRDILEGLGKPTKTLEALGIKRDDQGNKLAAVGYRLMPLVQPAGSFGGEFATLKPSDFVINAKDFGVPQSRERVFILGVREDIDINSLELQKTSTPTVWDIIGHLPKLRSGLSKSEDSFEHWLNAIKTNSRIFFAGSKLLPALTNVLADLQALNEPLNRSSNNTVFNLPANPSNELENFLTDKLLGHWTQHETRGHLESDIVRYLYCALAAKELGHSPTLKDWDGNLKKMKPNHQNIRIRRKSLETNSHLDRFKVQIAGQPSSTITSHIAKDGHYFIHPDPVQARSLTVREAARLQTFPDNYFFCGPRTEQYIQVGNAVPPYLAYRIATTIKAAMSNCRAKPFHR
jgi:DNA (cytosine-5)-methyltransferase 1